MNLGQNVRTPTGRVHESGQPGPLRDLLGLSLLNFDGMRAGLTVQVNGHVVETWAESYRLLGGEAIRRYASGPLIGEPAVVRHGNVTTIGAWSASLVTELLREILEFASIPVTPLPDGVRVARRGNATVWMNFNQEPARLPNGAEIGPVAFQMRGG